MSEYQKQQSNENKNKATEHNYESKQKEKKVNKFEFKDFKPNVFTNQYLGQQPLFNSQQTAYEINDRKTELRKQILTEENIPTRNPFSTQRQMPSIPQTHRGNIDKNNLYSVFESQPQKEGKRSESMGVQTPSQRELSRNQSMSFSDMNIERNQSNYAASGRNQQYVVNSQYMQNRVNPVSNTHANFMMQNTSSYNRNNSPNYHFPMEANQSSRIGEHSYLRRDQSHQVNPTLRQDLKNRNIPLSNTNFNRQPNEISNYNTAYPPIDPIKGNVSYPSVPIREFNNPIVKPRNLQNDSPNKNSIMEFDIKKGVKVETRGRKRTKRPSVETADSLQSLSSENEKQEKKIRSKKKKVKTYTHFYSKTDLFKPEKLKGYEMTSDPINLFADYDIFKGSQFCNKPFEGNILEYINKDSEKRKKLRKITSLLEFLKETNKNKETKILNEFFNAENSVVSLGFEEIDAALKVMFDLK